jgi:lysophospholipase L1-like esterase
MMQPTPSSSRSQQHGEPELRCVFFGDSITAGQYVSPEHHWTTLLRRRLNNEPEIGAVQFSVGAVSGDTSRGALERFPHDVQNFHPHVVTIQFGLNDCNRWQTDRGLPRVSRRAFEANLQEMVDRARRFGARKVILSTNHPTLRTTVFDDGVTYQESCFRYNEIIRAVADGSGSDLHDVEKGFAPHQDSLADLLLPDPDVLHLSIEGHRTYADLLESPLRGWLGEARDSLHDEREVARD